MGLEIRVSILKGNYEYINQLLLLIIGHINNDHYIFPYNKLSP